MPHQIALLGSAPSSDKLAPFQNIEWEIWACSPGNFRAPRVDAWFEMHSLERKWVPGNEPYVQCLMNHPRIYISKPDPRLPHGILYPKDEVFEFYGNGSFLQTFFQSQVSFMLALAIMQKPDTIGLWGIDMAAATEYGQQRPGCHFFFNEAEKRGIKIVAPPQSDILDPLPLYAYKEHSAMYWRQKARKQELIAQVDDCNEAIDKAIEKRNIITGALQDLEYTCNTWMK